MRLSSLSVFCALCAALLLKSDCSVDANMSALPQDMLALLLQYLPRQLDRRTTSKLFRGLSMFPLTEESSCRYIEDEAFRTEVNEALPNHSMQVILRLGGDIAHNYIADVKFRAEIHALLVNPLEQVVLSLPAVLTRDYIADLPTVRENINALVANPVKQIRLNLGRDFRKYMVNGEFRAAVNALVDKPLKQVWSDVEDLNLYATRVTDISPLAGLKNLKMLSLSRTRVSDIGHLAGLENLKELDLTHTPVADVSPLAELQNLKMLWLSGITDVSSLGSLEGLTIRRI